MESQITVVRGHGALSVKSLLQLVVFVSVCVLCGSIITGPVHAKIIIKEKTSYYPIKGKTGRELAEAMLVGGKRNIDLRHAIAATATSYKVGDVDIQVVNGRCKVISANVIVDIEYIYPKWTQRKGASKELRAVWDQFFRELVRHEETHGKIAKEGAKQLEREILRVSGSVPLGCRDFGAFSTLRLDAIGRQLKNRQLAFDRRENLRVSRISRLQTLLFNVK